MRKCSECGEEFEPREPWHKLCPACFERKYAPEPKYRPVFGARVLEKMGCLPAILVWGGIVVVVVRVLVGG